MKLSFDGDLSLERHFCEFSGTDSQFDLELDVSNADLCLSRNERGLLSLEVVGEPAWSPLVVDFLSSNWSFRLERTWNSKETLRSALGVKKGTVLSIVDGTGGLLSDSFLMSEWGHGVMAFEQNKLLAFIAAEACERAKQSKPLTTLNEPRCLEVRCERFEPEFLTQQGTDVLYLDPMYPEKRKAALNSKEMRIVKICTASDLHWSEDDIAQVILDCLGKVNKRIVLKRPSWAPPLSDKVAGLMSHSIKGKGTDFCVFPALETSGTV